VHHARQAEEALRALEGRHGGEIVDAVFADQDVDRCFVDRIWRFIQVATRHGPAAIRVASVG
jgi:hypothetical protein